MARSTTRKRYRAFLVMGAILGIVGPAHAQSLASSIYGYAEVKEAVYFPERANRSEFSVESTAGASVSDSKSYDLANDPTDHQHERGSSYASGSAQALYGLLSASAFANAGYEQWFYAPTGPGGASQLQPPVTNPYQPSAYSQTLAMSTDTITITSTSAAAGTSVPVTFRMSLDALRTGSASANGTSIGVDDSIPYYPGYYSDSNAYGYYSSRNAFGNMESQLTLTVRDSGNALVYQKNLNSLYGQFFFQIGHVKVLDLAVGQSYSVVLRLDIVARSNGGSTIYEPLSTDDTNRLENRLLHNGITATQGGKLFITTNSADGFLAASNTSYDGTGGLSQPTPTPTAIAPAVADVSASLSSVKRKGTVVTGKGYCTNSGTEAAGAFYAGAYISKNSTLDAKDKKVKTYRLGGLATGATSPAFAIRATGKKNNYLIFKCDVSNAVASEPDETDNVTATRVR